MGAHDKPLCKISMFLAGFIFFTPHRIAITCANHVVKRYHLPLGTVAMFVYRIHNLMELGSFAGTVINTVIKLSTTTLSEESKTTLKNCISGITMWLMFVWSIITYISFIAGGEYGYFGEFFWNIVMLVFIYGVYSNSAMGIEGLNAPFYIVGLPLFGLFTFIFHKLYKYLYYIYFWDEYDYVLVVYQIWIMIILSFATSVVWTVSRVLDTHDTQGCGKGVEIDISQVPTADGGKYMSGGATIQVTKTQVPSSTWVYYKHSNSDNASGFKLEKITHSDVLMSGGGLSDNMNIEIKSGGGIYVYYDSNGTKLNEPKVICISTGNPATPSNNNWYKAGTTATAWTVARNLSGKNPTGLNDTDLNGARARQININTDKVTPTIKLDKRPHTASSIQYRTKDTITVAKRDGNSADTQVPDGYVRYKHGFTAISNPKFKHNGFELNGINPEQNITAVYVYYEKNHDTHHEFPLIVCVEKGPTAQTYYKRGNSWTNAEISNGPEHDGVKDQLQSQFSTIIDKYEIKLEKSRDTYKARPKTENPNITVQLIGPTGKYKGYRHHVSGTNMNVNRITIHGQVIKGINNSDFEKITFQPNGGVYVYYSKEGDEKLQRPYLICLSQSGGTSGTKEWYKREKDGDGYTWSNANNEIGSQDPDTITATFAGKLDGIKCNLTTGGDEDKGYIPLAVTSTGDTKNSGLALLFGIGKDNKYHILHWSPIFLVALSLGTVYFFYPAISPYQLVDDPFDGKKIELWIQAISATPHIAFAITQIFKKGPGRLWTNYVYECDKYNLYALYHATWLFFIPYIACIYIFFSMMHFPDGRIGKYFRGSVFRTGVVCVLFAWVQEFMEAVGFGGGMGAQVSGKCGDNFNDDAGTIFGFMFLVFMTISMFTVDLKFCSNSLKYL